MYFNFIMIRLVQIIRDDKRLATGIEFDDGASVIRWHDGKGVRSYDHPQDLLGDAKTHGAEVLGLSSPEGWFKPVVE